MMGWAKLLFDIRSTKCISWREYLKNSNTGIGCAKVDSDCRWFRHDDQLLKLFEGTEMLLEECVEWASLWSLPTCFVFCLSLNEWCRCAFPVRVKRPTERSRSFEPRETGMDGEKSLGTLKFCRKNNVYGLVNPFLLEMKQWSQNCSMLLTHIEFFCALLI